MNEKSRLQVLKNDTEHTYGDVGHKAGDQTIPVSDKSIYDVLVGALAAALGDIYTAIGDLERDLTSDTDSIALEKSTKFGSDNSIGVSGAKKSLQSHFEVTTDWVESVGADNLATSTDHRGIGINSLEFDKIAGNATAMISKTISSFDDSSVTVWASGYPLPTWLKIDLGTAITACAYGLYSPGQNHPVDWTFEGSANGVTGWVVLDTQEDQDFDTDDWETTIDNENAYRYYRWNFTETSHTNIAIVKAKIYIETPPGVRDIIQQGCVPFRR